MLTPRHPAKPSDGVRAAPSPTSASSPPPSRLDGEPGAAHRIAELEEQVRALEARMQACEAERAELVTACHAAREAQRRAEAAVLASDELIATVTHDLRNPLGTIMMGATALLQSDTSDPKLARIGSVAERVHRQAERMTHQIANLSDYTVIRSGGLVLHRASHAPSLIIAAVDGLVGALARERGIAFELDAPAELPAVDCDADRTVQALAAVVGSAVRVTGRNGRIQIGAQLDRRTQRVAFFVRDTGPGLEADAVAGMFEPGWHSRQLSYKGTGMGYAIARGIADAHGGAIWAESAIGRGTTVYFAPTDVAAS